MLKCIKTNINFRQNFTFVHIHFIMFMLKSTCCEYYIIIIAVNYNNINIKYPGIFFVKIVETHKKYKMHIGLNRLLFNIKL